MLAPAFDNAGDILTVISELHIAKTFHVPDNTAFLEMHFTAAACILVIFRVRKDFLSKS